MSAAARALLRERCEGVPAALAAASALELPALPSASALAGRWVLTGVGGSEGPARVLCSVLRAVAGVDARFVPLSGFLGEPPRGDVLALFSQGLSPNARLPLRAREAYRATVLVTAADPAATPLLCAGPELCVVRHGPAAEGGLLLRVQGPAEATLAALRLALAVGRSLGAPEAPWAALLPRVPEAAAAALASAREEAPLALPRRGSLGLVVAGEAGQEQAFGLRWKWLEGLGQGDPPLWDALQLAHGPLQDFFDVGMQLLALEDAGGAVEALRPRLAAVLSGKGVALRFSRASLPAPLALFEHDARSNALLLRALADSPRDLARWPGYGCDEALYGLDAPPAREPR